MSLFNAFIIREFFASDPFTMSMGSTAPPPPTAASAATTIQVQF
jgi:hypothetical protein